MENDRPKFIPGNMSLAAQRQQDFYDHEQAVYGTMNMELSQNPKATHIQWVAPSTPNLIWNIPLERVEHIFSRAELSFRLAGIEQGLDTGVDSFFRSCVMNQNETASLNMLYKWDNNAICVVTGTSLNL